MRIKKFPVVLLLLLLFLVFGCTELKSDFDQSGAMHLDDLKSKCINLCRLTLDKNIDLSNGPCLGLIATDWVCDVAHYPRQSVDNLLENTCLDFASQNAHHFIEVNEDCKIIQIE